MAEVIETTTKPVHQAETTFKNYKPEDAAKYAAYRPSYSPFLIDLIVKSHMASGGELKCVVDIGCGPGIATRQIASHFDHVIGIDASPAMVEKARQVSCPSASGEQATFEVSASEEIDKLLEPKSVDLITVATAAHWFDMPRFYAAATKVLKPSGSITMWCSGHWYTDPKTTPNYEAVRKLWDQLDEEIIGPYEVPGNRMCRELYQDLDLPWTIDLSSVTPDIASAMSTYNKSMSLRREFNRDGVPDPSPEYAETNGFLKYMKAPLATMGKMLGTSSPITRWREAHREQLERGEIEDCIDQILNATRAEFAKAGTEGAERDWIQVGTSAVLIVVKKKE